eukprot:COSAG01_NODE_18820_length_1051_cov_0.981092_2_plen_105_part_00
MYTFLGLYIFNATVCGPSMYVCRKPPPTGASHVMVPFVGTVNSFLLSLMLPHTHTYCMSQTHMRANTQYNKHKEHDTNTDREKTYVLALHSHVIGGPIVQVLQH